MTEALRHRGPDQGGYWSSPAHESPVVFGHRRLSIIDLSEAGMQPMQHESGMVLCYNGECYNYRELRSELERKGHVFRSTSDTEVVLLAFVEWGISAVERFRGMFALALWDPASQQTYLVRDPVGIKPLYYYQDGEGLLFSSEIRSLLCSGRIPGNLDRHALNGYVWHGFVPGPGTMVEGVRLLSPGTVLAIDSEGKIRSEHNFWNLPAADGGLSSTPRDVEETLREAVRMRLVSDVPLGIFLSGGVDSSVLAALAQQASGERVKTFNVRFDEAAFDESSYARSVARALNTDHHEIPLSAEAFSASLEAALDSLDQPTFDGINTYFVSKAVREAGLTVALSGAGGDELFGGYASFSELPVAKRIASASRLIPDRLRVSVARMVSAVLTGNDSEVPAQTRWGKLSDLLGTEGDLVNLYQVAYSHFTRSFHNDLLLGGDSGYQYGLAAERYRYLKERYGGHPVLTAISVLEIESFVRQRLLRDTDTTSMAVSLEVRVPLLDHRFIEAVFGLREELRFRPAGQKALLRGIASQYVPAEIFNRKKAGFELPLEQWCRRRLSSRMNAVLTDLNLAHAVGLDGEATARLWRAFEKGGTGIYWSRVWSLFVLMSWCRTHNVYLR